MVVQGAGASAATLRSQRQKVFKVDHKTTPCRVRWEVHRAAGNQWEPKLVHDLRTALGDTAAAAPGGTGGAGRLVAVGLRAVERAVERGDALVVVVCTEGVPSLLMQHLPVICALRNVPVTVVATTPASLARAVGAASRLQAWEGGEGHRGCFAEGVHHRAAACRALHGGAAVGAAAEAAVPAAGEAAAAALPGCQAAAPGAALAAAGGAAPAQADESIIRLPKRPRERASPRRPTALVPRTAAARASAAPSAPTTAAARASPADAARSGSRSGEAQPRSGTGASSSGGGDTAAAAVGRRAAAPATASQGSQVQGGSLGSADAGTSGTSGTSAPRAGDIY
eukprot:CAMPEP_0204517406 /NCGR_PEP_ID=MMETSP0661-20131031/3651_1 /ASSEMBLY_ACC=CAM_ASM_000606 /TAXON_ID=109239 /ORGANISM="Alexandrium margalefi, Strain AMGDE01CS-322" /LENGTH=339 /DNA_ID=CAMNT_0051522801 /DNA_START=69 /DNA_END=1085 /DNA_ORIENTATION=-